MTYLTKYLTIFRLDDEYSLLVNTLTNAKDVIDRDTFSVLDRLRHDPANTFSGSDELMNQLKERGYVFDSQEEESELLRKIHAFNTQIKTLSYMPSFIICPTMGCNLRCTYCFEPDEQHKNYQLLDEGQLNTILNKIRETCDQINSLQDEKGAIKKRYPRITLFGGEPLLPANASIIERVLDFAAELDLKVTIITNGTNIACYSEVLEKNKQRVIMQITLDGDKETHDQRRIRADGSGTFDKTCEGIDKALEIGIPILLRVNVDKDNLQSLNRLKDVFRAHGWIGSPFITPYLAPVICNEMNSSDNTLSETDMLKYVYDNDLYGTDNSLFRSIGPVTASVESFFKSKSDSDLWRVSYCGSGTGANFCFVPDGLIYPCLNCCGQKEHAIGTFHSEAIEIDRSKYDVWKNHDAFEKKKCKECKYLLLCGGSCPASTKYDEEDCEVRLTYERVMESYVRRNYKTFLE